uniref:Elongation of very long chain fatty acids protein n=1 Tax=Trichuris muris TaxID=70415 RepID=A0A5S6QE44_TRIMR
MSVGLISLPEDYFDAISSPDAFMKRNWHHCLYWAFTYLCIVHVGPVLMKGFRKWNFRFPLVVWNMLMTVYSCWTLYQVAPEFFRVLSKHGLSASYCNRFGLFEGDTLFLILRQRPVVYIHYFHHTAVLLFCWYSYRFHTAPARWGVFMNSAVHSVANVYATRDPVRKHSTEAEQSDAMHCKTSTLKEKWTKGRRPLLSSSTIGSARTRSQRLLPAAISK